MKRTRRKFTSKFKAKIVLEVLKERETVQQIASRYEIHPNQISMWKSQFLSTAENLFDMDLRSPEKKREAEEEKLYKKIGQLQVEVDFLKKSLGEI